MGNNLRRWSGKHERYQYDMDIIESWDMQIDDEGNIWYMTKENPPELSIWCAANRLRYHLHHLEQIEARRSHSNE